MLTNAIGHRGKSKILLLISFCFSLLLIQDVFWAIRTYPLGHDLVSYLVEASRHLSGVQLYGPQLSETNPPLIIWFSVLPVLLARLLHITETTAFFILQFALVFATLAWVIRIARKQDWLRGPSLLLLALAIAFVELPTLSSLFGQRENLFLIFAAPYMIATALQLMPRLSRIERCLLGLSAGVGICFKPQQVLVLVVVEIAVLVVSRSLKHLLSIELIGAVLTCCLYVAAIATFAPLYFSQTIPLLLNAYWALGNFSAAHLALRLWPGALAACLVAFAARRLVGQLEGKIAVYLLLAGSIGASLAYCEQHTGWGYQLYPAVAFLILALIVLLTLLAEPVLQKYDSPPSSRWLLLLVPLALFIAVEARLPKQRAPLNDYGTLTGVRPGDSIYIFSTKVEMVSIAYTRNLQWGSRFMHLWMLPAILRNESNRPPGAPFKKLSPDTIEMLSAIQREDSAADLDVWKPSVVLVEKCPCSHIAGDFDILAWFQQDVRFRRAWSPYKRQPDVPGFTVFRRDDTQTKATLSGLSQ